MIYGFSDAEPGFDYMHVLKTPNENVRIMLHVETRFSYPNKHGERRPIDFDNDVAAKHRKLVNLYKDGNYSQEEAFLPVF